MTVGWVWQVLIFTCIAVDFVLGGRGKSLVESYDQWRAWADEKVCCDYSFHVGVTWWSEQVHDEMKVLAEEKGMSPSSLCGRVIDPSPILCRY